MTGDLAHYGYGDTTGNYEAQADALFHFIVNYVLKAKGTRKVDKYLKENPGRSPLDLVLGVDWAHSMCLVANGMEKWKRAVIVMKLSAAEQAKYTNWDDLEGEDCDRYKPVKERFTSSGGTKKEFCDSLFSDDGHKMMRDEEKNWDTRVNNIKMRKWLDKGRILHI